MKWNSLTNATVKLFLLVCFMLNSNLFGQSLMERIEGKTNFEEIRTIAEDYYQDLKVQGKKRHSSDPKYKHWKRWEWYHQDRLDPNGDIRANQLDLIRANNEIRKIEKSQSRSTNSDWTFLGPDGHIPNTTSTHYIGLGRVDRIAFHPTDPNTIFIGTPAGGIWKTTDDGNTWTANDDYLPSMGVSGIVINYNNPNIMYVLTGCGDGLGVSQSSGVFKSTNGGETWEATGIMDTVPFSGYTLEMDPNNDQVLFAATSIGLFKTIDGGETWNNELNALVFDVKFKPGSSSTIYAATVSGLFYSPYGGYDGSWSPSNMIPAPTIPGRCAIAVTEDDPNRVYLHMGPETSDSTFQGFYYSSNSGADMLRVATSPNIAGPQASYDFCVTASPIAKNVVIAGGLTCWRTTNSGTSWTGITTYGTSGSEESGYVHPDIHAVAFNPLNNHLYVANDGGLHKSTNNGDTWTNLSDGIGTTMFYHFDNTPLDVNYILGGNQDNGIKMRKTNVTSFDHVAGADGFSMKYYPGNKSKFYGTVNFGMYRYWNNGAQSAPITPKKHWFQEVETHYTNSSIVFAGTDGEGGRLYRSTNAGSVWDTLNLWAGAGIYNCPSNLNRIYFTGSKRVFVSNDLGISADSIHHNPGFPTNYSSTTGMAVNPLNSQYVYVTLGGFNDGNKVVFSDNMGASWTNISANLPNVATNCIATTGSGDLYVGTDIGVFYKKSNSANWIPFRNKLPNTIVTELYVNETAGTIRAATFGRGIWESPLADGNCENNLDLSSITDMEGYNYYEAENSIINTSEISGGMTTNVFLKSGNYIDLKEGFRAKNDGLYFKAFIGPCSNGGIPGLIPEKENSSNK